MLNINLDKVNHAISESFEVTADKFSETQIEAMEADIYPWDGTVTYRKSGEVVDYDPRNIVDTGNLRNSLLELQTGLIRRYIYTEHYAMEVHYGYINEFGTRKPGRPWTEIAQRELDLEKTMGEELKKRLI